MKKELPETLSGRVQYLREKLNISREKLAELTNLPIEAVDNIEEGSDLFLSSGIRQRLAKSLRVNSHVIKEVEKHPERHILTHEMINNLKELILEGDVDIIRCPRCNSVLNCKIVTLYDMEDNPVDHPKAKCEKCPFQIT
jgi:transcriptional regulator with XRE-family HTH domain